jgi:hypothetical protein
MFSNKQILSERYQYLSFTHDNNYYLKKIYNNYCNNIFNVKIYGEIDDTQKIYLYEKNTNKSEGDKPISFYKIGNKYNVNILDVIYRRKYEEEKINSMLATEYSKFNILIKKDNVLYSPIFDKYTFPIIDADIESKSEKNFKSTEEDTNTQQYTKYINNYINNFNTLIKRCELLFKPMYGDNSRNCSFEVFIEYTKYDPEKDPFPKATLTAAQEVGAIVIPDEIIDEIINKVNKVDNTINKKEILDNNIKIGIKKDIIQKFEEVLKNYFLQDNFCKNIRESSMTTLLTIQAKIVNEIKTFFSGNSTTQNVIIEGKYYEKVGNGYEELEKIDNNWCDMGKYYGQNYHFGIGKQLNVPFLAILYRVKPKYDNNDYNDNIEIYDEMYNDICDKLEQFYKNYNILTTHNGGKLYSPNFGVERPQVVLCNINKLIMFNYYL